MIDIQVTPRMLELFRKADPIARRHWKNEPVTLDELLELKEYVEELHAYLGGIPVVHSPLYIDESTPIDDLPDDEREAAAQAKALRRLFTDIEESEIVLH